MIPNLKSLMQSIAIGLKAKQILGHVTQGQENVRRKRLLSYYKKCGILLIICKKYILNAISFNRNTHKTRLFIDQLTKMA